jgi:PAS domain S-box-containing protein
MGHDHSHDDLMGELAEHFRPVLEASKDAVYLWLDDENMVCNDKCAKLWGYPSADAWASAGSPFLDTLVAPGDQGMFAGHYQDHVGNLAGPVRFKFKGKRRDGTTFAAETDMIPISFGGHAVAYHFVRAAK